MCCKRRSSNRLTSWLSKRVEQIIILCNGSFKLLMRTLGPVMFLGANILALCVIYILLFILMPPLWDVGLVVYLANLVFIMWCSVNIYYNYWACATTSPGLPVICNNPGSILGHIQSIEDGTKNKKPVKGIRVSNGVYYKYCQECPCIKPPRAHHCSIMGRCVLNMDHYCPWMCNCVGYYNYRYFVLFLAYMCLGAFYVVCFTMSDVARMTPDERSHVSFKAMLNSNLISNMNAASLSFTTFAFSLALSALLSTGGLLLGHLYLIITNQTTLEFYINMARRWEAYSKLNSKDSATTSTTINTTEMTFKQHPFDEGWRKNLRRVFGDVSWYIHLFPNRTPPAKPLYAFNYTEFSTGIA